jgi:DNA-binding MarR family transcriptional regulator
MDKKWDFPYWMYVLRYLNRYSDDVYQSQVSKELDVTYSHTVKIMESLRSDGFVSFRSEGRIKFVSLTVKGKALADLIDKLMTQCNIEIKRGVK